MLSALSTAGDVIEMEDSPVGDSSVKEKAPWWKPEELKGYKYVKIEKSVGNKTRLLEAFFATQADDRVYIIAHN
jgi:hypothetical protein